jgi:hypothetical protein
MISVNHVTGEEWRVTVGGSATTQHQVRVTQADLDRYGGGHTAEELLQESFRFLLEREPNTSILGSFNLNVISRYFPEYEGQIQQRMRQTR